MKFNYPVKDCTIVVACAAEFIEIVAGLWRVLAIKLYGESSYRSQKYIVERFQQ